MDPPELERGQAGHAEEEEDGRTGAEGRSCPGGASSASASASPAVPEAAAAVPEALLQAGGAGCEGQPYSQSGAVPVTGQVEAVEDQGREEQDDEGTGRRMEQNQAEEGREEDRPRGPGVPVGADHPLGPDRVGGEGRWHPAGMVPRGPGGSGVAPRVAVGLAGAGTGTGDRGRGRRGRLPPADVGRPVRLRGRGRLPVHCASFPGGGMWEGREGKGGRGWGWGWGWGWGPQCFPPPPRPLAPRGRQRGSAREGGAREARRMREAREYATLVLLRRDRRWMAFLPLLAFGGAGSDTLGMESWL